MLARHWGRVMSAMVTPFTAGGALDLHAAVRLARWLADNGNDGLVVAATTGEASTRTDEERCDLIRAVSEAVTIPVLAGTGSNDTAHTVMLTRQAQSLGAAGVLVVAPYDNRRWSRRPARTSTCTPATMRSRCRCLPWARHINAQLLDSCRFVNSDDCVYLMSIKAMLRTRGLEVGECRLPLPPTPREMQDAARAVTAALCGQ